MRRVSSYDVQVLLPSAKLTVVRCGVNIRTVKDGVMSIEEQGTTVDEIVDLLRETAEAHHTAYEETDGADPDWPIWYAGYLLEHGFNEMLNASILKSELVYLLITVDRERASDAPGSQWDHYYADFFATRYLW